jgi:hypothetical protein
MQYFDDMDSKYGFDDGAITPAGVEVYRAVYVEALNTLLDAHQSCVRVVAWDRPGMHNWCMIVQVSAAYYYGTLLAADDGNRPCPQPDVQPTPDEYDPAYYAALDTAMELGLDDYIEVTVRKDLEGLHDALAAVLEEDAAPDDDPHA